MFDRNEWNEYYKTTTGYKNWLEKSKKEKKEKYNSDPEYRERVRQQDSRRRRRNKHLVLTHYSKVDYPCCVDCGEWDIRCLSIDHINGGGTKHRKETGGGTKFHIWLKKQGFPEGYDTVCMNCNFRRRYDYP